MEATGSMHWFLRLLEELEIEFRVGHPAKIRAAEPRKQKNDRRNARLLVTLLVENRFPANCRSPVACGSLRAAIRE